MFTIGDFARHGRISVRMLRHYDSIGLLRPARVDRSTGYRFYEAAQLARLNRVVALKDLGFTLAQVQAILDENVSGAELRGMLRLRQSELRTQISKDQDRLGQVEARLRIIESEDFMPTDDVIVKPLPAIRIAELTGTAAGYEHNEIGPVVAPMFGDIVGRLQRAGVPITGPAVALYENAADGSVIVHAGMQVNAEPSDEYDFTITDLPAIERAATVLHCGSMDTVGNSWQNLGRWIDMNGHRSHGFAREVTIEYTEDPAGWVTELQEPI
ncbi:MerR family transcriptional regulator [Antrihabitans cavernicola]|uniref:MerR family transcriptional regulator n=1 Tax=Antrihabitans cavernicola TaxID=2495913 RepID=A0A5A7SEE8_9NOCA|nr:MerR family transcriptional regulator [Spelaeibacter cavernicola]KAA0023003.1 MerR family transcriptional regulator [Spelaeibacter cavernicola]